MITPISSQKNVLKEYLEKALPHFSHFPICIEIITLYCTSFPTRFPYPVVNEAHRIFYELPPGKVGKNGKIVKQSKQKGDTCSFYATRRLLKFEQTSTPHHALCSQRRKAMTAAGRFSSHMLTHEARSPADETFLRMKGLDPLKASHASERNLYKSELKAELKREPTFEELEMFRIRNEAVAIKKRPGWRFINTNLAAEMEMREGYGLQTIPCNDLLTINGLIETLRLIKGPLMIMGFFGRAYYSNREATALGDKIGGRQLYGWKQNCPFTKNVSAHAIVVVGASEMKQRGYVYWIDPHDPSFPNQPEVQKIYVLSFNTFVSRIVSLTRLPLHSLSDGQKQTIPGALYNPQFTTV